MSDQEQQQQQQQQQHNTSTSEYGTIPVDTSPMDTHVLLNEEYQNATTPSTTLLIDYSNHHEHDCSICLEQLKDPVWCGQGNCSMRSCRHCLIKWCENGTYKCPHCQVMFSKEAIKSDDQLRLEIEKEQENYPHVIKQMKEQKYLISLQQQQLSDTRKRIMVLQSLIDDMEIQKTIILCISFVLLTLWLCNVRT